MRLDRETIAELRDARFPFTHEDGDPSQGIFVKLFGAGVPSHKPWSPARAEMQRRRRARKRVACG